MEYLKLPSMDGFSLMSMEEEEKEKDCGEEFEEVVCNQCPTCSYQTRIYGCLICFGFGFLVSIGSTVRLITLLKGNPTPFAVMYTSGNIISICATMFLYGPWTQAKRMFAPERFAATCIYFSFMALTLALAFYPGNIPLRVLLITISIVCQFCALLWYTLSYIPYGRDLTLSCMKGVCPSYVGQALTCDCLKIGDEEAPREASSSTMFRSLW